MPNDTITWRFFRKEIRQALLLIDRDKLRKELAPGYYAVERVVGKKKIRGETRYEVKWRGWDQTTFELPQKSFAQAIKDFEAKK